MKRLFLLILLVFIGFSVSAQQSVKSVTIQTNGVCEQCKKRMMENVPQWPGVKECSYDTKTGKLTVSYDSKKTSVERLRSSVSKLGYDADDVKANAEARAKLPACCRQPKSAGGCGGDHHGNSGGCGGCNHHH